MVNLSKKLVEPHSVLIEKTAAEFAGTFFEAARSTAMGIINLQGERIDLRKYKNNPVKFARAHLEKFIPAATHALIEIMSKETTPASFKEQIYQALMERTNDPDLNIMGQAAGLPEYEKSPLYKSDQEKPKPVIINSTAFNFDNKKV